MIGSSSCAVVVETWHRSIRCRSAGVGADGGDPANRKFCDFEDASAVCPFWGGLSLTFLKIREIATGKKYVSQTCVTVTAVTVFHPLWDSGTVPGPRVP